MKLDIKLLEKLGQTQSIQQYDSVTQMITDNGGHADAFKHLKSQSHDLVCMILPDDDDEE